MLLFASAIKLITEVALLALLGQGALALLAGPRRHGNVFYRVLKAITRPAVAGTRLLAPRVVLDRHIPLAAFALLLMVWLAATAGKIALCLDIGLQACR